MDPRRNEIARRWLCCLLLALPGACGQSEDPADAQLPDGATAQDGGTDTGGPGVDVGPAMDAGQGVDLGPTVDTGLSATAPTVELGGSDDAGKTFVDWSSDTVVPNLVHGIQGGEHVFVSVRVRNMDPKNMNLELHQHVVATGEQVFPSPITWFNQTLKKETVDGVWTGWYFKNGYTGFVNCPCLVTGKQVKLELIATSSDGKVTAKSTHFITPGAASALPLWDGDCNDDERDECKKP